MNFSFSTRGSLKAFLFKTVTIPAQNLFILIKKSTSSGVNLNQAANGLAFCFCKISLTKGTKSFFAVLWETWHWAPILPHMPSSMVLLPLVQNKVIILIGGEMNSKGL